MTTTAFSDRHRMVPDGNGSAKWWRLVRITGWSLAALVLLAPAVAMYFTPDVRWGPEDFLFAALLVGASGLLFELVLRRSTSDAYRTGALLAIATTFLLVWSNAAVGFVGSGANTANVLYLAIAVIPLVGAFLPRLQARTLSHLLLLTATAQVGVTGFAFATDAVTDESQGLILTTNAVFVLLWCASALLFRLSGDAHGPRASVFQRSPVGAALSVLLIAIGAVLLTYMLVVEQEPGLPPLVLITLGTGWFLTVMRGK